MPGHGWHAIVLGGFDRAARPLTVVAESDRAQKRCPALFHSVPARQGPRLHSGRAPDPRPYRAVADRPAPHRHRPDSPFQLPLRATRRRNVHSPPRGHGPGSLIDRLREGHPRRPPLARAVMGRRAGHGRRSRHRWLWPVPPDASAGHCTRRRRNASCHATRPIAATAPPTSSMPTGRPRRLPTSRRTMSVDVPG